MAFKDKKKAVEYNRKFNEATYNRVSLMLPKSRLDDNGNLISEGRKEKILKAIKKTGDKSVNAFIIRAIDLLLEKTDKES